MQTDPRADPTADEPSDDGAADRRTWHEREALLFDAAIEAELATGAVEETREQARTHVLVRLARMTFGFLVCLLGLVLMVLPGPGLVVLAAGLIVLALDFAWADRALQAVRRRLPADEDGKIPTRTWVVIAAVTAVTVGLSTWWSLAS